MMPATLRCIVSDLFQSYRIALEFRSSMRAWLNPPALTQPTGSFWLAGRAAGDDGLRSHCVT